MQASDGLVEVDIMELSKSPCPDVGLFGLWRRMVKELDLKLTLGMAEMRYTEYPPDEESWRGSQVSSLNLVRLKVTLSRSLAVSCLIGHSTS